MDLPTQLTNIPILSKLTTHLRIPLYRNGYALVLSSALTSALGLLYWVVAARNYTTEAVGLNSAVLSAMVFLANLSALNLNNALNRFIPTSGRAASRLVRSSYLISVGTALIASLIFISGLGL
ncbi:MAG: oligosaccharide flippase family protein, partial [Spirochaetaceae bacterium]